MRRRWVRLLGASILVPAVALLVLSLDLRPEREPGIGPISQWGMTGPAAAGVLAGAAKVEITPPEHMPLGGFAMRLGRDFESIRDPIFARALAVSPASGGAPVVLVSLDAVLVPAELAGAIRAEAAHRVKDMVDVVVTATHTHSGPGGLRRGWLGALMGMGRYDSDFAGIVVDAAVEAAQQAVAARVPVVLSTVEGEGPAVCDTRQADREADRRLTILRLRGEHETIARVVVFSCHATFLGHGDRRLSAEWPGEAASRLDGVTFMLQGAVGDQRPAGFGLGDIGLGGEDLDISCSEGRMVAAGRAVAEAVRRLDSQATSFDERRRLAVTLQGLQVNLPQATGATAAPPVFRRLAGNALARAAPAEVRVSLLRLGDARLLFVPAEVVSVVAHDWERMPGMRVVSLADGYIGYLETPEALESRTGESRHAYFHEDTVELFGEAIDLLVAASLE